MDNKIILIGGGALALWLFFGNKGQSQEVATTGAAGTSLQSEPISMSGSLPNVVFPQIPAQFFAEPLSYTQAGEAFTQPLNSSSKKTTSEPNASYATQSQIDRMNSSKKAAAITTAYVTQPQQQATNVINAIKGTPTKKDTTKNIYNFNYG